MSAWFWMTNSWLKMGGFLEVPDLLLMAIFFTWFGDEYPNPNPNPTWNYYYWVAGEIYWCLKFKCSRGCRCGRRCLSWSRRGIQCWINTTTNSIIVCAAGNSLSFLRKKRVFQVQWKRVSLLLVSSIFFILFSLNLLQLIFRNKKSAIIVLWFLENGKKCENKVS